MNTPVRENDDSRNAAPPAPTKRPRPEGKLEDKDLLLYFEPGEGVFPPVKKACRDPLDDAAAIGHCSNLLAKISDYCKFVQEELDKKKGAYGHAKHFVNEIQKTAEDAHDALHSVKGPVYKFVSPDLEPVNIWRHVK